MPSAAVTNNGQVIIPKEIRQKLGIQAGSRIEFALIDDHVELHLVKAISDPAESGFGLLKSPRSSVPVDFDPATLAAR